MKVTLVHVVVKSEHIDDFISATSENHLGSIREPGNLRFDVLQSAEDPTTFVLYEAFVDEAAAAEHKKTPHYLKWRDAVGDWMAIPRKGVPYKGLLPKVSSE